MGTVNIFEAAADRGVNPVAYASSVAVYGAADDYPEPVLTPRAALKPSTLYGAYKVANEQSAGCVCSRSLAVDCRVAPAHGVWPRPGIRGLTSQPTAAIYSAARAEPYRVDYRGVLDFQYAPDVARMFIMAARSEFNEPTAAVANLRGHVVSVSDFLQRARDVTGFDDLSCGTDELPFPYCASTEGLAELVGEVTPTPLDEAIAETYQIVKAA